MTTSVSPSEGISAASAGRSMPGMVRSASLLIAISAPVLPALTAAPASPAYWAMRGYRAVILDGGGLADVALPVGIMATLAVVAAALAVVALRDDAPKRTWG